MCPYKFKINLYVPYIYAPNLPPSAKNAPKYMHIKKIIPLTYAYRHTKVCHLVQIRPPRRLPRKHSR